MRVFRIKARGSNGRVLNQREYVGIVKLRMYGHDTWRRYNRYATAELYQVNDAGKWLLISDPEEVRKMLNPYGSDEVKNYD